MAENEVELRRIAWSQTFPFVRLFRTLGLALDFKRLTLALAGVVLAYLGGRILDSIWIRSGAGVTVLESPGHIQTEVEAYSKLPAAQFNEWRQAAATLRDEARVRVLVLAGKAADPPDAQRRLASSRVRSLVMDAKYKESLRDARKLVTERLKAGLEVIAKDKDLSRSDRASRRAALIGAADSLRLLLDDGCRVWVSPPPDSVAAMSLLLAADPSVEAGQLSKDRRDLQTVTNVQHGLAQCERLEPRGPFRGLLGFETHCFAAAIEGVCAGRWGFAEGAADANPALVSSIASAGRGVVWLVTHRLCFSALFGLWLLVVFGYFGGAVCRSAAVQSARDEGIPLSEALRFAREKFSGFLLAPLMPLSFFIVIGVLIFLGGLVGAIPWIGELFAGVFYPLTLLGGFALAVILLAVVLGFHLMWPTIAVEGSDGFDALSRACSYVGSRIWHCGFYSAVLLLYGGVSFVLVRLVGTLTLKLAHTATKAGMNLASSGATDGVGKLDAIWQMPAWSDLSLLPATGDIPFWGTFHNAPLDGTETIALFFFRLWVYLVVGVVGAFVVNFFLCGRTQMYYLLRREVDATDWEEVYYEEPEPELPSVPEPAAVPVEPESSAPPPPADQPPEPPPG